MSHPQAMLGQFAQEIDLKETEIGVLREAAARTKLNIAFNLAALVYGVEMEALSDRRRVCRRVTEARQVAMYLAHVTFQVSFEEIGDFVNRNRGTVRYGIERVEDRRENPVFDALIDSLEGLMAWLMSGPVVDVIANGVQVDFDAGDYFEDDWPKSVRVSL
ncbi:MAG: hypothetical protein EP347_10320 [Alphaproteobacteria bacterium]|nr:MAG: hypothetical protein EP347_10320 [Alphaproteobacteria bacterium]